MEAEYVAKRSILGYCGGRLFLCLLFCWLIVPVIIGICLIIAGTNYKLAFYRDKVVCTYGIVNKHEEQFFLSAIIGVSVNYSLFGRIFHYGDVYVDAVGKWGVNTNGIKQPEKLKKYLYSRMALQNMQNVQQYIAN